MSAAHEIPGGMSVHELRDALAAVASFVEHIARNRERFLRRAFLPDEAGIAAFLDACRALDAAARLLDEPPKRREAPPGVYLSSANVEHRYDSRDRSGPAVKVELEFVTGDLPALQRFLVELGVRDVDRCLR